MTDRIQNYYVEIDKRDGEAVAKEGLTIEEWDKKQMEKKRQEDRKWHRQNAVMKCLKKPKSAKKRVVLAEDPENAQPIIESHSPIVKPEDEMAVTTFMPKPNNNKEMAGKANEPEPSDEGMVVNVPMYEPKK